MKKKVILLVDDEQGIRELYREFLQGESYCIIEAANGSDAIKRARKEVPDIIILDVLLPDIDGRQLCRMLRFNISTRDIPIVMTSHIKQDEDEISGFEAGADDYFKKTVSKELFKCRIKAVLRRKDSSQTGNNIIKIDNFRLEPESKRFFLNEKPVYLRPREFELLEFLITRPNKVLSNACILGHVWGMDSSVTFTPTLKVHIRRLREKLGGRAGKKIVNVPRCGYKFVSSSRQPFNHFRKKQP
ncbi:MAG: response regulator transcription factor [bacterium]